MINEKSKKIGFIGQGFVGKNYADDFEKRGFEVVRYALEEPHLRNKDKVAECDIVFIAVPTPTTTNGFDDSIVRRAVGIVADEKIVVIKSTVLPGTTDSIQEEYPNVFVTQSPEFLREANAEYDASNPKRNIIGYTEKSKQIAEDVINVLPKAPYNVLLPAKEAELIKYAGNIFLYFKVVYANFLYDLATGLGLDYERIKDAVSADPRIGSSHMNPVYISGHEAETGRAGRGAGGHCLIKDFAAFRELYEKHMDDKEGVELLMAFEEKNSALLRESGKDTDLLEGVYGKQKKIQ